MSSNSLSANPHGLKFPENFNQKDINFYLPHLEYELFEPKLILLKNVFYFENGVLTGLSFKKIEKHLPWYNWGAHYNTAFWISGIIKSIINRTLKIFSDKQINYVVVGNPFSDNYFHWITEVIPKLLFLKERLINFKLILPEQYYKEYQLETLTLLEISFVATNKSVSFFLKVNICSPFSKFPGYFNKEYIKRTQSILNQDISNSPTSTARIYISRKKAARRKIINEEELIPILIKYNFKVIYPEDLSYLESIQVFRNTKILVSVHGAALTNMIFMSRDSFIFELQLKNVVEDKCYFILSNALDIKYYYQSCEGVGDSKDHIIADLLVDANEFENNLARINRNT